MNPILNFKDSYYMYVLNGYRFAEDELPIMSFQTNKNGTFTPIITPSSGTLKWVVNGVEQITNTPSYSLVGDSVDVEVYANDVSYGNIVTNIDFIDENIIGSLNFNHFTLNGDIRVNDNSNLNSLLFSSFANQISTLVCSSCNFTNLNFSNVSFSNIVNFQNNSLLTNVSFSVSNTASTFNGYGCNLSSLDVSSFTFSNLFDIQDNTNLSNLTLGSNNHTFGTFRVRNTGMSSLSLNNSTINGVFDAPLCSSLLSIDFGVNSHTFTQFRTFSSALTSIDISNSTVNGTFLVFNSTSLTSITYSSSGNACTQFWAYGCNLNTIDLTGFTSFTGNFWIYGNNNLSSISFNASGSNTSTSMLLHSCNLSTIDFSSFVINGSFSGENNPLTSITFGVGNASSNFRLFSTNLVSMDLSGWAMSGDILIYNNTSLASITQPTITTGLYRYWISNCALPTAQIDSFFNFLNNFFSSNAPIKNLDTQSNLGTNGSPTGGASNTDIVNLDTVVYVSFDFIYSIN